jgi:CHAT domain-containing protein
MYMAFFLHGDKDCRRNGLKINFSVVSFSMILDEATGVFMTEFYRQVLKGKKNYSEAIFLTRQHFINGDFGEKYKDPYYCAAFRYFGN